LLSVFGGKITTYRKLAEHALQKLNPNFPAMKGDWTSNAPLPGGEIADADFARFLAELRRRHSWLPADLGEHYGRLFGTRADRIIGNATGLSGLGRHFGGLLYEAEIAYLRKYEWMVTADDLLLRRTKHGLHMTAAERQAVSDYMDATAAA